MLKKLISAGAPFHTPLGEGLTVLPQTPLAALKKPYF